VKESTGQTLYQAYLFQVSNKKPDGCLLFQVSNKKLPTSKFFLFFSFGASVLYYYQMQFWSNEPYHYSRHGPRPGKALDEPGTKIKN
jgi:hypothetical protein